jgi:hypothetical protein
MKDLNILERKLKMECAIMENLPVNRVIGPNYNQKKYVLVVIEKE